MKNRLQAWLLLIVLSLVWGSSFILMKKGLEAYPPVQVGALRICIATLALLPVCITHLRRINPRKLFYIFLFGLTNAGLPAFLFAISQTRVNSSTAGMLNSLTPLFTLLAGVAFFKVRFDVIKLIGVVVGFFGALLLLLAPDTAMHFTNTNVLYTALIVFATICYGFSSNILKHYLQDVPGHVISAFSYACFAVPLSIWLFFASDFTHRIGSSSLALQSFGYIALLAVFGSAVAIILYSVLVQRSNALFGSFVTYLIPFVALMWGLVINESVEWSSLLGLVIILIGIYIAGRKSSGSSLDSAAPTEV